MKIAGPFLVVVFVTALVACNRKQEVQAPPPPKVPVVQVITKDVPVHTEAIGETAGSLDVPIRARVDGVLEKMAFTEGMPVKKGQLLYVIDDKPFLARVREADGRLAEANARFVQAQSTLKRVRPLVEIDALSKRTLDDAIAENDAAKGLVQATEAQVEDAKIELGYTKIHSPIAGLIGITEAHPGEYVGRYPNPVVLNTVSKLDPIKVRFSIVEQDYLKLVRRQVAENPTGRDDLKPPPEEKRGLDLFLADGSKFAHRGHAELVGREIDAKTGTLTIEALFPNPQKTIRPGQFARIRATLEVMKDAPLVPQRAVQELQGTYQVFVVDQLNKIESRRVTPGIRVGTLWVIKEGLEARDRVVVSALHRVRPGMTVEPVLQPLETVTP